MHPINHDPAVPGKTFFERICDIETLRTAHELASKNKKWYKEVQEVEAHLEERLSELSERLKAGVYRTSKYDVFERKEGPKIRKIYKLPYYPDRIVQWAILLVIKPILDRKFIFNTYSSIKYRGPHKCLDKIRHDLYNHPELKYYLKMDVKKFYPNINHDIIKLLYAKIFNDVYLLDLIYEIISSVPENEGIPIGNYLSQYSANIYLSEYDHIMKENCGCKYYYRYMDDIVILSDSKEFLHDICDITRTYMEIERKLEIKNNYQINHIQDGLDFVGYMIRDDENIRVRKRIKMNYIHHMKKCRYIRNKTTHVRSVLGSYYGILKHGNCAKLYKKYYIPGIIDDTLLTA